MPENRTSDASRSSDRCAVCIQTNQIYDNCRSKECLEDLRVYLTNSGQELLENAVNVKARKAEIIWVFSDVEPVPFQDGYYTVDLTYFFHITLDVYTGVSRPQEIDGLAVYNKKVVLFGSEGNAKIFQSGYKEDGFDAQLWRKTNMPKAIVEVVDPVVLSTKVLEPCDCHNDTFDLTSLPKCVEGVFDETLSPAENARRVYVSLGLFSLIRLERRVQLLIPSYDFCIPDKECISSTEDSPCDIFEQLEFPVDEFFPPMENCQCPPRNCRSCD